MIVSELITELQKHPQDASIQLVNLKNKSGKSDCLMTVENIGFAEDVRNADGTKSDEKIICIVFGS